MNSLLSVYPEYLRADTCIGPEEGDASHYLWAGSLRKTEGGIDFTLGASNRASKWIFLSDSSHGKLTDRRGQILSSRTCGIDLEGLIDSIDPVIKRMRMAVGQLTRG